MLTTTKLMIVKADNMQISDCLQKNADNTQINVP